MQPTPVWASGILSGFNLFCTHQSRARFFLGLIMVVFFLLVLFLWFWIYCRLQTNTKKNKVMFYYKPRIKPFLINGPIFANADYAEEKENLLSMDSLWAGRRNQCTGWSRQSLLDKNITPVRNRNKKNCNSLTNNSVVWAQLCEFLNLFVVCFFLCPHCKREFTVPLCI